ncbi:MAG: FAD-dependent oxidoreductase [Chloroflexi bacterium]|nr:FAD-dependent oxidoreductase [Chloroflexota bacterium]
MSTSNESRFPILFSPFTIGGMTLRNRIVNTPHGLRYAVDHLPSERHFYYHTARARGGVGYIIMESTSVHPSSASFAGGDIWNFDDSIIPKYERLAEAVHKYGAKIGVELNHTGRQQRQTLDNPLVAPSIVPTFTRPFQVPHPLDKKLMREIIEAFAQAALRCQRGGMDAVELHGGQGGLMEQFMSPFTNRRTDEYGGSLENRMRFGLEALTRVREMVGRSFIVGMRINASELWEGGLTVTDMQEIAARLDETGMLDYLSVTMGHYQDWLTNTYQRPDMSFRPGAFVPLIAQIKQVVKLPVIAVGRINHPAVAEAILEAGQADLIGMVRALISDPEMPNKAREGRLDEVRFCVAALEGCVADVRGSRGPVTCIQNPVTSREKEWGELQKTARPRRVVVVGGGPAGTEVARVAALRGHGVILLEETSRLGGQVLIAARAPGREEFGQIASNQEALLAKTNVEIHLRTRGTVDSVLALRPEVAIVATGCRPTKKILGTYEGWQALNTWDVLLGNNKIGKNVLLFDELGNQEAFGAAEYLAVRGHRVEFVTRLPQPGQYIQPNSWRVQMQRMAELSVRFTPMMVPIEQRDGAVTLRHAYANRLEERTGVDAIVLSLWHEPQSKLFEELKGQVPEIHLIGDAISPRGVLQAFYDANKLARRL